MSAVTAPEVLCKQPSESVLYKMSFVNLLGSGESLTGTPVVVSDPIGLEISDVALADSNTKVQMRIKGGKDGMDYRVEVQCNTDASNVREADGELLVRDK